MDVILFLLNTTIRLALALMGLAASFVMFLVRSLRGALAKRAQQNPTPQEVPSSQPMPAAPVQTIPPSQQPASAPAVHVHVHLNGATAPAPPTPAAHEPPSNSSILARPDHRIYITTGSHFMMEHPEGERLLDALDHMLYVAAHRDGNPFSLTPLDPSTSGSPVSLPPADDLDDIAFLRTAPRPMPRPDGALWLRKAGSEPQRLAEGTRL